MSHYGSIPILVVILIMSIIFCLSVLAGMNPIVAGVLSMFSMAPLAEFFVKQYKLYKNKSNIFESLTKIEIEFYNRPLIDYENNYQNKINDTIKEAINNKLFNSDNLRQENLDLIQNLKESTTFLQKELPKLDKVLNSLLIDGLVPVLLIRDILVNYNINKYKVSSDRGVINGTYGDYYIWDYIDNKFSFHLYVKKLFPLQDKKIKVSVGSFSQYFSNEPKFTKDHLLTHNYIRNRGPGLDLIIETGNNHSFFITIIPKLLSEINYSNRKTEEYFAGIKNNYTKEYTRTDILIYLSFLANIFSSHKLFEPDNNIKLTPFHMKWVIDPRIINNDYYVDLSKNSFNSELVINGINNYNSVSNTPLWLSFTCKKDCLSLFGDTTLYNFACGLNEPKIPLLDNFAYENKSANNPDKVTMSKNPYLKFSTFKKENILYFVTRLLAGVHGGANEKNIHIINKLIEDFNKTITDYSNIGSDLWIKLFLLKYGLNNKEDSELKVDNGIQEIRNLLMELDPLNKL